mmetsp:Transcript_59867/g.192739  ORF Transcript_59867/g.192739 Transcript_59867/m.192739 type:complete len:120 (-) Transcript_59867:98-457(-)
MSADGPAWLLVVRMKFADEESVQKFLGIWATCAAGVREKERGVLAYELARSDKDPLLLQVFERYTSKSIYLEEHKITPHLASLRAEVQAMQAAGKVEVTGESFDECGIGWMVPPASSSL